MRPFAKIFLAFCFLLQPLAAVSQVPLEDALRADVEFLCSPLCEGRAAGTRGGVEAAAYIARRLSGMGYEVAAQSFAIDSTRTGHNIYTLVPQGQPQQPLTVVMACYDGIGSHDGQVYPGADSNASGVAALLALAERLRGKENLVFVFTDARNVGGRGAKALLKLLKGRRISLLVNLDIVGSSLVPVDEYWRDYLIALGAERWKQSFERCNAGIGLHLYYDYYRSRNFTSLFYRKMGDQAAFVADGVPAILFTSGITANTNKASDTPETLDYGVFARRVEFISRFLNGRK